MGASGGGKTTVLRLIGGQIRATAAQVPAAVSWTRAGRVCSGPYAGPSWVRVPASVLAVAPVAMLLREGGGFPHSATVSVAGYLLLCLGLAAGWLAVALPAVQPSSCSNLPTARTTARRGST